MVTIGQILAELVRQDGVGYENAKDAMESIVLALGDLEGDLSDHLSEDGDVLDDWVKLGNRAPREGEMVLIARRDDIFADGPVNAFVGRYTEDSGVAGWTIEGNFVSQVQPAYDDDEWKRF